MMEERSPALPIEVIFLIIGSVVEDPRIIYSPSDVVTKTLLSCTRICRATHRYAMNMLRQHCVYIDSHVRLQQLIRHLDQDGQRAADGKGERLQPVSSLFLSPFKKDINNLPTTRAIYQLFQLVHPTLRRLVIDMPLRSLYPEDDDLGVRRPLRDGFSLLVALEEFVSVRDELYLNISERVPSDEPEVWTMWPRLRRLGLYNPVSDSDLWQRVRAMSHLTTLVFTRADGLESCDMKAEYLHPAPSSDASAPRPLRVLLVNAFGLGRGTHTYFPMPLGATTWRNTDPDEIMHVSLNDVPALPGQESRVIEICQKYVKARALRGNLWDWPGRTASDDPTA